MSLAYGHAREHHVELASTNDRAAQWLREGGPHGLVVTADRQSAGRGRLGREWASAHSGDLYASVGLRPNVEGREIGALGLAAGVGLREGLAALTGLDERLQLKWPNDVWLDARKVAGILCETRWAGSVPEIVVGFGVNVARREFSADLAELATSLVLAGESHRAEAVLESVLVALQDNVERYFEGGFGEVRARYEAHCVTLGRRVEVRVARPKGQTEAILAEALGLADDGALRARALGGGEPFEVRSDDVWLR